MSQFWWVIYPYLCLAVMIGASLYRFVTRPRGWGSKSSQILEKKWLQRGSLLFHWGMLFVVGGHVLGLLIPLKIYQDMGVSTEFYHLNADVFGGLAGLITWLGCLILLLRRILHDRVRQNSSISDFVVLALLFLVVSLGDFETIIMNNLYGAYEYRLTIGPWVRGLLLFHPDASLMAHVPGVLQVHIALAFALFAVTPFSRLVHVWSAPLRYPTRAPIQYRARTGRQ